MRRSLLTCLLLATGCSHLTSGLVASRDGAWAEVAGWGSEVPFGVRASAGTALRSGGWEDAYGPAGMRLGAEAVLRVPIGPLALEASVGPAYYPGVGTPFEPESSFRLWVTLSDHLLLGAGVRHGWGNGTRHLEQGEHEHASISGTWEPLLALEWRW